MQASGGGASISASLPNGLSPQGAFAVQNALANIGLRTQSITLMRDSYYRICEAYLSGKLDPSSVAVMIARAQDLTATVLAVEQLTGAVRGPAVVLTAQGSPSASETENEADGTPVGQTIPTAIATNVTGEQAEAIAGKVENIVKMYIEKDYTPLSCLVFLNNAQLDTELTPAQKKLELLLISGCIERLNTGGDAGVSQMAQKIATDAQAMPW